MKLNKLAIACGLAVAAISSQAMAHGPAVTPDLQVFISGASAQQNTLGKIVEGMMTAGTIDVYYDTASNGKDYRAYFGTVSGTGTALDGKKVLIHNRAKGGSFQGVGPVARAQAITRMAVDAGCSATGAAFPAATYKCTNTVNAIPDAGVSDVEPAMFRDNNLPAGELALNDTEMARLTVSSQNAVVMGIAVTDNFPLTSLSRSQITSILSGAYRTWDQVNPTLPAQGITVERRAPGSGTQASANAFFGGNPCVPAGAIPLAGAADSDPATGYTVVENGSTGNVKSALTALAVAGKMGIGLVSLENVPVAGTDKWHHIAIDGVAATEQNAWNGKYDYFVEQTFQYRNAAVGAVPAPSVLAQAFLDTFSTRSGDQAVLSGLTGAAALPTLATPVLDVAGNVTNGVMKGTKLGNTCQPTQLFY